MKIMETLTKVRSLITKRPLSAAILILIGGTLLGGVLRQDDESATQPTGDTHTTHAGHEQQASLWTCAMHPQIRLPSPGDCPICGMDLIPVATTTGGLRTLTISPASRALMNIATAPVERKYVSHEIPMVGKVDYDETHFGYITAWVPGRLDRLYVDYTGVQVNKGDHMVYIYSPELYSAQEELIQALKYRSDRPESTRFTPSIDLVESSREKLRLLGLTDAQITQIESQDRPSDHLTIYAPLNGVVIDKLKQEGEYVRTGERIYTVADLNQVWVFLDAYESDLTWIRYGQDVTITTEAYPGEEFHGRIAFIQPVLNDKTRTVKVRVNVPNPKGKLKPDMFVHAVVRPQVAAGGRVMDPSLSGKWICPMHPEIVKDNPGTCDICGMPLVRAKTLGYVTPEGDEGEPPLVIPYSAALVTGRRAVVYIELPVIASKIETAYQGTAAAVKTGDLDQIQQAFANLSEVLDKPYDQPGTDYARSLWNHFANRIAEHALAGQRAQSKEEAAEVFAAVQSIMTELREQFGPVGQPTFEGREIVLGPRAGDYYLVKHGLEEGELVVTQGNFKLDAEIQIQAKPSMMTPEGGGGGGHHHDGGGGSTANVSADPHAEHAMALPEPFKQRIRNVEAAYKQIAGAVEKQELGTITASFARLGQTLEEVDASLLTGHARMQWHELAMLLGNDAVEGREVENIPAADRVFLLLKGHMRRLREQLRITPDEQPHIEHVAVSPEFEANLRAVWGQYLAVHAALSADQSRNAHAALVNLRSAIATVNDASLSGHAKEQWIDAKSTLTQLFDKVEQADDIGTMRAEFKPLSETIGTLAKAFGFGEAGPIYELHCPMAFQGKGAVWYQDNANVRNPYYGTSMLTCADRVEEVVHDESTMPNAHSPHQVHAQH